MGIIEAVSGIIIFEEYGFTPEFIFANSCYSVCRCQYRRVKLCGDIDTFMYARTIIPSSAPKAYNRRIAGRVNREGEGRACSYSSGVFNTFQQFSLQPDDELAVPF